MLDATEAVRTSLGLEQAGSLREMYVSLINHHPQQALPSPCAQRSKTHPAACDCRGTEMH